VSFKKVSFLGDSGVGKTSLIRSYLGKAEKVESTIGVEHYSLTINSKKVVVWDFSGQKWFADVLVSFVKGSNLLVFVFDLSEPRTLPRIYTFWLPQISKHYSGDKPFILVGNKKDKEKISEDLLERFVEKFGSIFNLVEFMKTSIYDPNSVKDLFNKIVNVVTKEGD